MNDTSYEGMESLTITLELKEGDNDEVYLLPDYGNITIYISDPEDGESHVYAHAHAHVHEHSEPMLHTCTCMY